METILWIVLIIIPIVIDLGFQYFIHRRTVKTFKGCFYCPHKEVENSE